MSSCDHTRMGQTPSESYSRMIAYGQGLFENMLVFLIKSADAAQLMIGTFQWTSLITTTPRRLLTLSQMRSGGTVPCGTVPCSGFSSLHRGAGACPAHCKIS